MPQLKLIRHDLVSDSGPVEVIAEGRVFAVFRVEDGIHVIDGVCAHAGGPLGKGTLRNGIVTCPWHGWQFDVRSGQLCLNPRICQTHYAARVEEDFVVIDVEETLVPGLRPGTHCP